MLKLAKIINPETKQVILANIEQKNHFESIGFSEMEVEEAYDGHWYAAGYAPAEPEKSYAEKRLAEYPSIGDQLDMMYWDKVNGTNIWQLTIAEIKAKYPKE